MSIILRIRTKGMKELKARGFEDNVLNALKLALYDGNVDLACKYYRYDEWCHQYCIFSKCKNNNNCKGNHRYCLTNLIKNKEFCKGKLLCEYLLYFYTNYCAKQNKNKKRAWIAQLHWECAQIYAKDECTNLEQHALAQLHYQQAVKNHWHKSRVLVDYAIFLQHKMHNPNDGEICLIEALKCDNNSVTNLQMGKFLLRENRCEDAIEYFGKVLRLNEFCPQYNCQAYYGFGFSLYKIGDINGAQEMYDEAFRIDKKTNHGELKFAPTGAIEIYTQIKTLLIGSDSSINSISSISSINSMNRLNSMNSICNSTSTSNNNNDNNTNNNSVCNFERKTESQQRDKISRIPIITTISTISTISGISSLSNISENVCQSINIFRCDEIIEKKEEKQIEIRLTNECNPLIYEFEMFWKDLPYFEPTKSKYLSKFVSNEYNSIAMITFMTNDVLMNEIGMNTVHSKLFENFALKFKNRNKEFLQWLKSFKFSYEYELIFLKFGIYSFESFYRRIKNVQSLINKLKNTSNDYDEIIDYDCYQMWQNTPRYKRKHRHVTQTQ